MRKILGTLVVGLLLTMGVGRASAALPAPAPIVFSPTASGSLTYDGLTFTVTGGSCDNGGEGSRSSPAVSCTQQLYLAPGTGPDPSVIIEAASGGFINSLTCTTTSAAYSSATSSCGTGDYDLSLDLTVSTVSGKATLTGASVSVTGSASSGFTSGVGGTENIYGPATTCGDNTVGIGAYLTPPASPPPTSCTFAGISSISLVKDFGLSFSSLPLNGTMQLTSITESFTEAPEPASLACLLAGIGGLAAVRRRRRPQP